MTNYLKCLNVILRMRNLWYSVQEVPHEKVSSYGIVATRGTSDPRTFTVANMVEKPRMDDVYSNMAVLERYVTTPNPGADGEIQMTGGLRSLLKIQLLYAYSFEGRRYDVGDKLGFR